MNPVVRGALIGALVFVCARSASPEPNPAVRDSHGSSTFRVVPFAWTPPGADHGAYEMSDPEDQHRLVMVGTFTPGGRYPVVVAMHGQPRRGEAPRNYAFGRTVIEVARNLVEHGTIRPFVLALPVFRYQGTNWPSFDLKVFRDKLSELLATEHLEASGYYVVGHSGAAGCGGDGMNRAHRIEPAAVGFFDTCLGAAWRDEVLALRKAKVPTWIIHSVETAGFTPRQAQEYLTTFDFGRAYAPAGLAPSACPDRLPEKPLRQQPFQCASDKEGITRALVVDTGEGEQAHNALVPVALAYFLREYLSS
jgi:hypothetical protein